MKIQFLIELNGSQFTIIMARKFKWTILFIFLKIEFLDTIRDFLTLCVYIVQKHVFLHLFYILKIPDPEPSKARCLAGAQFFKFFRKKILYFLVLFLLICSTLYESENLSIYEWFCLKDKIKRRPCCANIFSNFFLFKKSFLIVPNFFFLSLFLI